MADGLLAGLITRFLKVPSEPEPPMGSPGSVRVFNAASGYYRYRLVKWAIAQAGTFIGLIVGLFFLAGGIEFAPVPIPREVVVLLEATGVGLFIVQLPLSFLMVRLDYRYRWYMITDTSLRIREGLMSVRERTMTFANIQNLSLHQGPVQRLFGISDLQVRTAGGGADVGGESKKELAEALNMHIGYFRGVDNAEEIRDVILSRMRSLRDSGLGDPDEPAAVAAYPHPGATDSGGMLAAARELLAETRRLRSSIAS